MIKKQKQKQKQKKTIFKNGKDCCFKLLNFANLK
jgi:hypothetical protein